MDPARSHHLPHCRHQSLLDVPPLGMRSSCPHGLVSSHGHLADSRASGCSLDSGMLVCMNVTSGHDCFVLGISSRNYDTLLLRELRVSTTQRVRRGSRNGAWRRHRVGTFIFRNQLQWWHALGFTLQFMSIVKTGGMELTWILRPGEPSSEVNAVAANVG